MIRIKLIYFNYMIFSSRSGPILNLTWDEFEEIERSNQELTTNKHKTGKIYTVHIFIQEDQRRFLRAMRVKYIEEFGADGNFIFASAANKVESGISRSIREEFKTLFGDDPAKVRFNANFIRKFWERLWSIIKGNVSEGVNKAHLAQTAHSEKTAQEHYLSKNGTRQDRMQVLEIYSNRLLNRGSDEDVLEKQQPPIDPEPLESDFEEEGHEEAATEIPTLVDSQPVTLFNMVRDSLRNSTPHPFNDLRVPSALPAHNPRPHPPSTPLTEPSRLPFKTPTAPQIRKRDSMEIDRQLTRDTAVEKYQASLTNFRSRLGLPEWTEEEKLVFFYHRVELGEFTTK